MQELKAGDVVKVDCDGIKLEGKLLTADDKTATVVLAMGTTLTMPIENFTPVSAEGEDDG